VKRWLLVFAILFQAYFVSMAAAEVMPRVPAADLAVEAIATSAACLHGKPCIFHVVIRNQGTAPYRGPITLIDDVPAPALTLLAEPLPSPWTCVKKGRGQFDCRYPDVTVEPGRKLSVTISLKVIGAGFGKKEHCGIIEWGDTSSASRNQAVRDRLSQIGYPIRDGQALVTAIRDFKTKVGLEQNDVINAELAASLLGPWGEGDSFSGNDKGCASFELLEEIKKPLERCRPGEGLMNGKCVSLATYCPGGQNFEAGSASCKCPDDRPIWSSAIGQCHAANAAETCKPGQSMAEGECLCPREAPVWSARQSRCVAIEVMQLAAATSKTDLAPSCSGGRIPDPSGTSCVCPQGLRETPDGCIRHVSAAPPSRPVLKRPMVRKQRVQRISDCPGARVWSRSLGRCVRIVTSGRQCSEGQIRRNGRCIWPKRAQVQRPVARKAATSRAAVRVAKRCDGLLRWSASMRHCIPFWIWVP
jgi:hypothetical protein